MTALDLNLPGLKLLSPKMFGDSRGYFYEAYSKRDFEKLGINCDFIQDNQSHSKFGTLRGLHFQKGEHAQAKLVRVIQGQVFDVCLDLRLHSPTFGKHCSILLTAGENQQLFIPRGFAHGFVTLSETATFEYKCDNYYNKSAECGILYNDPELAINWKLPEADLIISNKDLKNSSFEKVQNELRSDALAELRAEL